MRVCKYTDPADKGCAAISRKKHSGAQQLAQETRVCDYLARYTEDINKILARAGEPFVLSLEFEEANNNNDSFDLNKLDPISADYVKSLIAKIRFANRKMLRSFKLKLAIEEVSA